MLIFLVASGLSLIFGLLDVLNFGQGAFVLVGAYVGYATYQAVELNSTLSFLAAAGAAIVSVGLLGAIIEAGLIRPLYERPVFQIVLTFGLGAVLLEIVGRIWGVQPKQPLAPPELVSGNFFLFSLKLSV